MVTAPPERIGLLQVRVAHGELRNTPLPGDVLRIKVNPDVIFDLLKKVFSIKVSLRRTCYNPTDQQLVIMEAKSKKAIKKSE